MADFTPRRHWPALFHSDGTPQSEQRYAALQSDYFQPDTLNFNQLLSLAAGLAENIRFVDAAGDNNGSWQHLFAHSEPAILAQIAALEPTRLQQQWLALTQQPLARRRQFVLQLLQQYSDWYRQLLAIGSDSAVLLADKLYTSWQTQLAPAMAALQPLADATQADSTAHSNSLMHLAPAPGSRQINPADALTHACSAALQLCRYLQQETAGRLTALLASGHNEPALALLLAFLDLYRNNQQQLNQLTARHQAFYYDDCLKMPWQQAAKQRVWLSMQLSPQTGTMVLPADTLFSAGKDSQGRALLFSNPKPQWLSNVQVQQLYSLSLLRSQRISPEHELGFVSRLYSSTAYSSPADPRPLFIADDAAARMPGFAVESPVLQLSEGERSIELALTLSAPDDIAAKLTALLQRADYSWPQRLEQALALVLAQLLPAKACSAQQLGSAAAELALQLPDLPVLAPDKRWLVFYQQVLLQQLARCDQLTEFFRLFGILFSYYLLGPEQWLSNTQRQQLLQQASQLSLQQGNRQSVDCLQQLLSDDRMTVFYRYCSDMFLLSVSTADGDAAVAEYSLQPLGAEQLGLRLHCQLSSSFAAVCGNEHGSAMLQLRLNPMAKLCGYSLCSQFDIVHCKLEVSVRGARSLNLSNQQGLLDSSKPFWPFGPVPGAGSYLLFNHADWQHKQLQQLELELQWAELPRAADGFSGHYAAYGDNINNSSFTASLALLDAGRWQSVAETRQRKTEFCLFSAVPGTEQLQAEQRLSFSAVSNFRLNTALAGQPFHNTASEGFFRLSLQQPQMAFGHSRYATALSNTLLYNARHKRPLPLPQPPYSPQLQLLSVNYRARADIYPRQDPPPGSQERLLQLFPFGRRRAYPAAGREAVRMLPYFPHQAYICFGLAGADISGQLSLLFDIEPAAGSSNTVPENALHWQYLHNDQWLDFSAPAVLADSSYGLTSSGGVLLQLPHSLQQQHQLMPSGVAWLRLCCSAHSRRYGRLRRVLTNVVPVEAVNSGEQLNTAQLLNVSPLQWQAQGKLAGVAGIDYLLPLQPQHKAETAAGRQQRIAERLSHKQRASTARDFERLVLQAFPQLAKVKCFPNAALEHNSLAPGRLLLIVVAAQQGCLHQECQRSLVSGDLLRQIKHYVAALSSPFAAIEVANPGFEQLQVRCAVKLAAGLHSGDGLQRLQLALSDYLCPWHQQGLAARFGWELRPQLLQSFIQQQPYIDYVTDFSLLHISRYGSRQYRLFDSARQQQAEQLVLRPLRPWNLLTPAPHHALQTVELRQPVAAQLTGVSELEIGQTFIIQQEDGDG